MIPFLATDEIIIYGAEEIGISAVITAVAMFILIAVLIAKVINVMSAGQWYESKHIWTTLILGLIFYFMVLVGALINQTVTFAVYLHFSTGLISIIGFFTVIEAILSIAHRFSRPRLDPNRNKFHGYGPL
jgi:NhaP-type Na+/H+ or K+/H+ antiporter